MKSNLIRNEQRGHANHGWLHARHSFSFGSYFDPSKMGFGRLRVLNDDTIEAGAGFGTHPHRNMEIITIPLQGCLRHRDSGGNEGLIRNGEIQVMSAGTGIRHSEYNGSDSESLNLLQIWVEPGRAEVEPRYEQARFDYRSRANQWHQVISPMGSDEPGLKIHQNSYINIGLFHSGQSLSYDLKGGDQQGVYLFVIDGQLEMNGQTLHRRDAIEIADAKSFQAAVQSETEVLLIEVPLF
ncbi:MAG: pirin family protein [Bdellovibrionales bacterium]|nr:pirin family protein [Bdellovibrionales bacterium]